MATHKYVGGCRCGNVSLEMEIAGEPNSYRPRACDCDFCRKHAAAYISDPRGKLTIHVKDAAALQRHRHGDRLAAFLVCGVCGVLVGVCYEDGGRLYATVNSKAIAANAGFGAETATTPKTLSGPEKILRWKNLWFSDVRVEAVQRGVKRGRESFRGRS